MVVALGAVLALGLGGCSEQRSRQGPSFHQDGIERGAASAREGDRDGVPAAANANPARDGAPRQR